VSVYDTLDYVRSGYISLGLVRSGYIRLSQVVMIFQVHSCYNMLGQVISGKYTLRQIRSS